MIWEYLCHTTCLWPSGRSMPLRSFVKFVNVFIGPLKRARRNSDIWRSSPYSCLVFDLSCSLHCFDCCSLHSIRTIKFFSILLLDLPLANPVVLYCMPISVLMLLLCLGGFCWPCVLVLPVGISCSIWISRLRFVELLCFLHICWSRIDLSPHLWWYCYFPLSWWTVTPYFYTSGEVCWY